MYRFILYSLKQFCNSTSLSLLFLYALFCWLTGDMLNAQNGALSSNKIIDSYNMIIFSLVMMNSIYFIISHFRETLNSKMSNVLVTRLGKSKYFWSLIICYFIYFIGFYLFPLYLTALFQQIIYGSANIFYSVYFNSFVTFIIEKVTWSIILSVILYVWIKNDLLTLIIWSAVYFTVLILISFSEQYQISSRENLFSILPVVIIILANSIAIISGILLSRKLTELEYTEKISNGLFSSIAGMLGFELSKFHYKMLGLKTQTLFMIFGSLGFVFILSLLNGMGANNTVISKIYVAVFFPLLFSFNQYNIIEIDLESGMLSTNLLRKIDFGKIVFNRWFTMLTPQILLSIIFSVILLNIISGASISFLIFVLVLNVLFSSVNFFLSIHFNKSGYANFIIGFIVYLMLREDIQTYFNTNPILNYFNIFESLTSFTNHNPTLFQIILSSSVTLGFIILSNYRLKKATAFLK